MSGSGLQFAHERAGDLLNGRSPLAHLLHALNQPLTGLQCSLELAVAFPQRPEQYVQTLRDGLELTSRMRILVEALRELADCLQPGLEKVAPLQIAPLLFDELLRDTIAELLPIAEGRSVQLQLVSPAVVPLRMYRRTLAPLLFRLLESALSLAQPGSALQVEVSAESGLACLTVSWNDGTLPEHAPCSRPELGLLIAQAGLEQAGAECRHSQIERRHAYVVRLPLVADLPEGATSQFGGVK